MKVRSSGRQTEDEIAAITMTIGGALTGTRSATATSGPGFSLMAEALGWAGMNEVPLVVSLYQRGWASDWFAYQTRTGRSSFCHKSRAWRVSANRICVRMI